MPLVVKDRVQETSTTTGTGTFTLAGAVSGFQSFSVIGNANTTYYAIVMGSEWEVGLGTYTSSGTTLSRDTVLESSNSGSLVNFSAGTKNVFVTYPAEKSVYLDNSDKLNVNANGLTFNDNTTQNTSAYGGGFAMRNRIINGDFDIAQRGTSFTSTSSANNDDTYNLDRWYVLSDGNDIVDITQTTTVPTTGPKYSIGLDVETVNKKFGIAQIIEHANCYDAIGGNVTLSFQARVSATTKLDNVKCAVVAWSGTADTVTSDIISAWNVEGTNPTLIANATYENTPANLNVTTSWATYSVTANVDTASTTNIIVFIWSDVTDTTLGDFLYVTNVQLEKGSTATSFDYRPYSAELAMCQRYYYRIKASGTNYSMFGPSWNENTTRATGQIKFPVTMRTRPTALEQTGTASNYSILHGTTATTCSSVPAYEAYTNADIGVCFYTVSSGLTAGQGSALADSNGTSAYLGWSAEL